jgi:uncharacterized RDD family membrane protein YckC
MTGMLQLFILVLGLSLLVLSFLVVVNSSEQNSRLYPGSNVRFLATMPSALVLVLVCPWFITMSPQFSWLKTLQLLLVIVLYLFYAAWMESSFRGGLAKRALKAQVVDRKGREISFKRALSRNIFKLLFFPLAPFCLFFMIKDFRRQAPHDKLTDTFVIWTAEAIREMQPESSYRVEIR